MTRRKKINYIVYIIFLFIYVFSVPFIRFNTQLLFTIVGLIIILFTICCTCKMPLNKRIVSIIGGFIPFIIYISIMFLIHYTKDPKNLSAYYETYILFLKFYIYTIIICSFFEIYRKKIKVSKQQYINALITVACIQLICVILAFINPTIRTFFVTLIKDNTTIQLIYNNMQYLGKRSYGLSENLYDSFGYICALLIVFTFWKGKNNNKIFYVLLAIIMLIMPTLNSRTGLVLSVAGIIFIFIFSFHKHSLKNIMFVLKTLTIIFMSALIILFWGIHILPRLTLEWVQDGISEIFDLMIHGQQTGTFEDISEQIVFPNNIILGAGSSPEYLNITSMDMGYAQCIWRYGIVGTILLIGGYINLFRVGILSTKDKNEKALIICMALFFFAYLYKIYSIGNMAGNLLICGYILLIINTKNERNIY